MAPVTAKNAEPRSCGDGKRTGRRAGVRPAGAAVLAVLALLGGCSGQLQPVTFNQGTIIFSDISGCWRLIGSRMYRTLPCDDR